MQSMETEITRALMGDSGMFQKLDQRKYQTVILDTTLLVPFVMVAHNLSIPEIVHFAACIYPTFLNRVPSDYSGIPELSLFPLSDITSFSSRLKNFGIRVGLIAVGSFLESYYFSKT
jgi:hypothetical protein